MSLNRHIEHLHDKHAWLDAELAREMSHPAYDFQRITNLKKEKLRIKEAIADALRSNEIYENAS